MIAFFRGLDKGIDLLAKLLRESGAWERKLPNVSGGAQRPIAAARVPRSGHDTREGCRGSLVGGCRPSSDPVRSCREAPTQFRVGVTTEVLMDEKRLGHRRRSIFRRLKRFLLQRPWVLQVTLFIIRLIVDKTTK